MGEHISNERLAALLDDGVDDAAAREHLASCPACERELDLLRRMRMALSAMDQLEPPTDQWERIEAALPRAGAQATPSGRADREDAAGEPVTFPVAAWARDIGWLRAAAAVVLFAGGLWVGSVLGPLPGTGSDGVSTPLSEAAGGTPERTEQATGGDTAVPASASSEADLAGSSSVGELEGADRDEILQRLEALGSGDLDAREAYRNPTAAAERLARLDALVRAAREALEEDPADPAMNQFLFRVVEERQRLNQALHLASLDYR